MCIVRAVDMESAVKLYHALEINPGGEVAGMTIDETSAGRLPFDLSDRIDAALLS